MAASDQEWGGQTPEGRGRVGEQEERGWADIPVGGGTQCVATRQGQVVEAAWPQAGTGQMPGPIRANQGTEPMSHTEVKMDRSQNMMPSELNHRGGGLSAFADGPLRRRQALLPASALSGLPGNSASLPSDMLPSDRFWQPQEGGLPERAHTLENSSVPGAARPAARWRPIFPSLLHQSEFSAV